MSHKQQMCYPRRQCTHGAASMLEQEQWVQPGITQCQLQHLTMPHKQPVCHLRMQRVPTCMTEAVVVHRCFCRSHAHCWRMSHMTLESSLLVALCAVLCCTAGGATGFAIGGYRYLNLPADPAFSTIKLKTNRLINTSGTAVVSHMGLAHASHAHKHMRTALPAQQCQHVPPATTLCYACC